jgi:hypothetical protein
VTSAQTLVPVDTDLAPLDAMARALAQAGLGVSPREQTPIACRVKP